MTHDSLSSSSFAKRLFVDGFIVFTPCSVLLICHKPPDLSYTLTHRCPKAIMPSGRKSTKPAKSAKFAKSPVVATTSRPARVAKAKAKTTIRTAIVPKPRVPRGPATARMGIIESASGSESSDVNESSNNQGAHMEDIRRMIQSSITEALAAQDRKENDGNFTTALSMVPAAGFPAGIGTVPLSSSLTSPPAMPQHVLSRWPWVQEDTIKTIALGNFEIDNLPKLHRSDELRNAYLKRSMKGIYQPLDGGPAEIIVGTSKLHSSFRDPITFFLAWQIYVSIRAEFKPEMGTRLAYWTERVQYFVQLNYPWPAILEYIIAYYQTYQDRMDPVAWFKPDSTLLNYHLTLVQQKPTAQLTSMPVAPTSGTPTRNTRTGLRPKPTAHRLELLATEICMTYNRTSGCSWKDADGGKCPRRHVCGICVSSQHTAVTCPTKGKSQK